ncbi:MAG: DUF2442 domain-containing protein [Caldilineaceae bacterium]
MTTNQDDSDYRERAKTISFGEEGFSLETVDGKWLEFSYSVSPRLLLATQFEREAGKLMPGGYGIEWEELDEHLSVDGLVHGKVSTETWRSVYEWYELRQLPQDVPSVRQNGHVVISQ